MRRAVLGLIASLLVLATGCAGPFASDDPDPPSVEELVAFLPKDSTSAVTLDVASAREQVEDRRLQPLVESTLVGYPNRDYGPLYRALDASQVTGIVRSDGPPEVLLIATEQRWEDARKAFEREGWTADSTGALKHPGALYTEVLAFVTGRDGLIVLSGTPAAGEAARDGKGGVTAQLRELIAEVDGAARGARLSDYGCVRGVAIGNRPGQNDGEVALQLTEPADAGRVDPGELEDASRSYAFQPPRVEGNRLTARYRNDGGTEAWQQPAVDALSEVPVYPYDCGTDG